MREPSKDWAWLARSPIVQARTLPSSRCEARRAAPAHTPCVMSRVMRGGAALARARIRRGPSINLRARGVAHVWKESRDACDARLVESYSDEACRSAHAGRDLRALPR